MAAEAPMHERRIALESRLTVFLVDDHELLRLGLRMVLQTPPSVVVVGDAPTIATAVDRVATLRPSLVVAAATLPDGDAAALCRHTARCAPGTRVAVLTHTTEEAATVDAMRAGACGCVSVVMRADELRRAIRAMAAGEAPAVGGGAAGDDALLLTTQERRVLAHVVEGKTNREIALALCLSEKTVKNYLSNAFDKLQVSRRSQAAVLFSRACRDGAAAGPAGARGRAAMPRPAIGRLRRDGVAVDR
jgi:two-component system response regulator DevR